MDVVPAKEVISFSQSTFVFAIPKTAIYSVLRDMKSEVEHKLDHTRTYQLHSSPPREGTKNFTSITEWDKVLASLNDNDNNELKRRVILAHSRHIIAPIKDKNCLEYIQHHGQRFDSGSYFVNDNIEFNTRKDYCSKTHQQMADKTGIEEALTIDTSENNEEMGRKYSRSNVDRGR